MKKLLLFIILSLSFCNIGLAKSTTLKSCKNYTHDNEYFGTVFVDFDKKEITFTDGNSKNMLKNFKVSFYEPSIGSKVYESGVGKVRSKDHNYDSYLNSGYKYKLYKQVSAYAEVDIKAKKAELYIKTGEAEGRLSIRQMKKIKKKIFGNKNSTSRLGVLTYNCSTYVAQGFGVDKKKKLKKKTPKINIDDNKIVAASSGTGFFVSRTGHIVTNNHVIEGCSTTKVNYKGNDIEAKVIARDQINDLAILKSKINPKRVFAVSDEDVSLLQDIIVAGFPLGKRVSAAIKIHKGSVSALAGFGDNYSNFQTDATINQGNSGGPVMDKNGNIVGVAVALMPVESGQNIFFAIKSSTLKTFAKSNSLNFLPSNRRPLTNKDLGNLIIESTVFLECWMTVAKIKQLIAMEENRKAFYKSFKN